MSTEQSRQVRDGVWMTRPDEVVQGPTWATVAPLLARWQMALLPDVHGTWTIVSAFGTVRGGARPEATHVPFAALPAAIRAVAARCVAECPHLGTGADDTTPQGEGAR